MQRLVARTATAVAALGVVLAGVGPASAADDPPKQRTPVFRPGSSFSTDLRRDVVISGTAHITDVDAVLDPDEHCDRPVDVSMVLTFRDFERERTTELGFPCDAAYGVLTVRATLQDDGSVTVRLHGTVSGEANLPLDNSNVFSDLHADWLGTGLTDLTTGVRLDAGKDSYSGAVWDLTVGVS